MSEYPRHWTNCLLGERVQFQYGKSPNEVRGPGGKYPVYGSSGKTAEASNFTTNSPSIIVGRKGTIDKPIYLTEKCWAIDTTFFVDDFPLDEPKYLFYLLDSINLKSLNESTGVPSLSRDALHSISVSLPPLPEQKKIAKILSGIDNAIQRLQEALGSHERARNVLLESIFRDGYRKAKSGSDEWRIWTIEELLANTPSPMRSGPFGSALLKEELAKEGIPFLGIDNVRTEEFVPSFKRFLTEAKFNELRRYEVFPHDVMITIMGTVGRACVVPEGTGQCVSSKHTWTMTFDRKKVAPEIICWQLNHFSGTRKKFLESSQGGVMDAISSQTLREIEVPIPTNKEYAEKLAEQYLSSSRYQQALKAKLAKIRLLKNAVSSDILSGRKRVTL